MTQERDEELWELVQRALRWETTQGVTSPDPREQIYLKTLNAMRRHLFQKTRSYYPIPSEDDLEEILQDAYSDAFRSLKTFDPSKSTFLTWLCTIATRRSYKWIKKASRDLAVSSINESYEDDDTPHREPAEPGHILIEERQILKETLRYMVDAIADISNSDYRLVVSLVFFGWFTLLELRKILGLNPNTLKSAYRRGLKELRGKVGLRCGSAYEMLAVQIMETHKRGSLAKGMAVLDTDYVKRVGSQSVRRVLELQLVQGLSPEEVAGSLGMMPQEVIETLKSGVEELLRILKTELA